MDVPDNYGGIEENFSNYENSYFVVLPVPLEKTVSYKGGTSLGPKAIINASQNMELFDEEFFVSTCTLGIHTKKEIDCTQKIEKVMLDIEEESYNILKDKKFLCVLGGEHSISQAPVKAAKKIYNDISVLQFDAHLDLRDAYLGDKYSHASVMSRVEEVTSSVQVGIRSFSEEEYEKIKNGNYNIFYAKDIHDNKSWFNRAIENLSDNVYITFDIDAFDPSIIPGTGTPEPGGLSWYLTCDFLKEVFFNRNVVGADIVEVAPQDSSSVSEFVASKLLYKMMTYKYIKMR
ncbi:MAG: agmatinase [Candidatus Methanofastidiosum methylothiophilum]|uniref:Agmatinase n=1 Tax=Candidatus Methanofastidiosum methylothiophilum TaxID=1705564 RepID=A0A150J9D4_9EURY|nr:MAG: agmatinase [Candidatus Methanofastidiosum methylthiophilus]